MTMVLLVQLAKHVFQTIQVKEKKAQFSKTDFDNVEKKIKLTRCLSTSL